MLESWLILDNFKNDGWSKEKFEITVVLVLCNL